MGTPTCAFAAEFKMFVKRDLMDIEMAQDMLAWPHSGFYVHDGVWIPADDTEFAVRIARYCVRICVVVTITLGRMVYDEKHNSVTYHSDKPTGPIADNQTADALEFLAQLTSHIPDKEQTFQRYYGFYSSRQRRTRRKANSDRMGQPLEMAELEPEAIRKAKR